MTDYLSLLNLKTKELLTLLIKDFDLRVEKIDDCFQIHVDTDINGVLIGYHGETLDSLKTILSLVIFQETGEWIDIDIDIGDYQKNRLSQLQDLAENAAERVRQSQKSFTLPYLSAKERRFIHLYLQNITDIKTESVGDDEERRLVIFPQSESIPNS